MVDTVDQSRPFAWTDPRIRTAVLLAEDEKSDADIADEVGVSRAALSKWKLRPEFADRIAQHVAALEKAVSRYRIAKRRERIRVLDDLHTRCLTVIEERASVDLDVSHEIRALQKQAAQDLGQWSEKTELSGPGGEPLVIRSISVPLPVRPGDDQ